MRAHKPVKCLERRRESRREEERRFLLPRCAESALREGARARAGALLQCDDLRHEPYRRVVRVQEEPGARRIAVVGRVLEDKLRADAVRREQDGDRARDE